MVECPSCHTSNPPESLLCSKCSAPFGIDSATLVVDTSPPPVVDPDVTQVFTEVSLAATAVGGTGWSVPIQRAGASNPSAPLEAGVILGERYEILKQLGEGGMGAVYKARDHELDRLVALKVIRPELAGHPDILRRFKQELILARQVTHKNVVRIFDLGSADGRKFITMDYIEGRDLKSLLVERGKLPPAEVVPIFQQICRGLEAAHVEGVVHRDLKPQNIMLDGSGRVWLMDIGLARSMEMSGLTRTGVLMGTPDYMSPELARAVKVDARSDLFSLGIIVYEMLVGQLPFQADTLMAKLLLRVQQKAKPITDIDPSIPAPLAAVVSKCLEPDVTKRYQTIREILDDLSGTGQATRSQISSSPQITNSGQTASGTSAAQSLISLTDLGPGSQFGPRYRIESEIGEGGMGKVYKAYDSDLDRIVALKLVRPELAKDASSLLRFKQELLLASRISHRNVLRIHDLGDVGGVKFISMAYIQGMDLADLIAKTGKLQTERVVNIAKQLAGALEAAHAEGVVHRDLKPRNVLITVEDHVFVSDFGLAKSLDAETTAMTRAGEVLGTPRYMSPEQAESKAADHRSDLYSVGVILYEMATGEVPFTGESSLQVMFQHVQQAPKDPRLVNPDTPEFLASIILKCLEKDPACRYQSATELLRDLESATPATRIVRLRIAETGYSKWMFAAMGIVLVVGIGLAVRPVREKVLGNRSITLNITKTAAGPGVSDRFVAVMPLRVLGNDPTLKVEAEGVVDALSAKLFPMKSVHLSSPSAVEKINAEDPVPKIARQLGAKLIVQGTMQSAGDKIDAVLRLSDSTGKQLWTKDFSGVRQDLLTIEDQIYNDLVTALDVKPSDDESARNALRPTDNVAAYELYLKGRDILRGKVGDPKRVQSAVDLYEQAIKKDSSFALAYAGLADASLIMYNLHPDTAWSQKALSAAEHAQSLNDEIPEVHFALGDVYRATGKTTEAIVQLKRALELAPNSDEGYRRLGDAYRAAGKTDDALQAYQKAIDANPYYWLNHSKMGSVYYELGQHQKALDAFQHVVDLAPDSALGYSNLGAVNFQAGKWNDAIIAWGKALKIQPTEILYTNLGTAYLYLGHNTDAINMFQKAVNLNPNDDVAIGDLGDGYRASGDKDKSKAAYEKAIELALKGLRVNPQDAGTLGNLAYYYAKNGDSKKGLNFIARARGVDAKDNELMYKEAVINAMAGQQGESLTSLRAALQNGYSVQQAKKDPELKTLATNPDLDKLIAEFERKTN